MNIAILKHAYHPDLQGMEQPEIYCEENTDIPVDFETLEEAKAQIEKWNDETYYLSHNESGRPTYLVVENVDADYVRSGRNQDMSNYDWDDADCECGECNVCCSMMIGQDREYLTQNALYTN